MSPYAAMYFHFGPAVRERLHELRSLNSRKADGTRAQIVPFGSYVLQTAYEHDGAVCRGLGVYLVIRSLLDFPIYMLTGIHQPISDERMPLREAFLAPWREVAGSEFKDVETLLSIMAHLSMYLNSDGARLVERPELSDERLRLASHGPKALAKADRRLSCMCDWLLAGEGS